MQRFAKKPLALAVGAALAAGVSTAYAAAPTLRAANATLVSATGGATNAEKVSLLSTGGLVNTAITLDIALTSGVTTASSTGGTCSSAGDTVTGTIQAAGSSGACVLVVGNTTLSNNHVVAYTGTTATQVPSAGASASLSATVSGVAHITMVLPAPGPGAGYRINAGALEYSATASVASSYAAVKVDVQAASTNNKLYTENDGTAGFIAGGGTNDLDMTASTNNAPGNSLAPTPTIATASAAGGILVNGFAISTFTPITLAANNIAVRTTGTNQAFPAAAVGAPTCAANVCSVTFPGLGTVATAADFVAPTGTPDAADAAFYNSTNFNTGIAAGTVPFSVDGTTTEASYTQVFNVSDGVASKLAPSTGAIDATHAAIFPAAGTYTDGANPAIVSVVSTTAGTTGTTNLQVTFSEPLLFISTGTTTSGAGDLREVAEFVKIGANNLASLNLNANGVLSLPVIANGTGYGVLQINGVQKADANAAGAQVSVAAGISIKENNDTVGNAFSLTVNKLDFEGPNAGGVKTASAQTVTGSGAPGEFLSAAATNVTAPPLTVAWTADATAAAITTVSDATKVGSILITFKAGKEVKLDTAAPAKTLSDLANDLVVTVTGLVGQAPASFTFHPASTDLTLSGTGNTLSIALPTALIYSKIHQVTRIDIDYTTTFVGGAALVGFAAPNPVVSSGTLKATLPLPATPTVNTLLTQNVIGTLTGQSSGSVIHAWLAKWTENPAQTGNTVVIRSGTVNRAGDQIINGMSIRFLDQAALEGLIAAQLNAALTPAVTAIGGVRDAVAAGSAKPITVYGVMLRTNDTRADGNGSGTAPNGDNFQASFALHTTDAGARAFQTWGNDPVYVLSLDPNTGNLAGGPFTGKVVTSVTKTTGAVGLTVIGEVATGQVDGAGKFNLLAGVDPASTAVIAGGMASWANHFLILVHEDASNTRRYTQLTSANPAAANYVPFAPNLSNLSGTRTVLGVAPGIAVPTTLATPATIDLSKYRVGTLAGPGSAAWQIRTSVNPATGTAPGGSLPRSFVGVDGNGVPTSVWAGDGGGGDMAMAMTGSKTFFATELGNNKGTLSTITNGSFVNGAHAIALKSDQNPAFDVSLSTAQGNTVAPSIPAGWSLVAIPSATPSSAVDAIIRVGSQAASQFTWLKADGVSNLPALSAGEGVFVFSKLGGKL